jgi:hypothetical protein
VTIENKGRKCPATATTAITWAATSVSHACCVIMNYHIEEIKLLLKISDYPILADNEEQGQKISCHSYYSYYMGCNLSLPRLLCDYELLSF